MTDFSAAQQEAIHHKDGPMLVIAGPGSGKTTVLTHRILHLVTAHRVQPGKILVITFTKAAAKEMEQRYRKLCRDEGSAGDVAFGTFHSVFYRILQEYGGKKSSFRLSDEREALHILREAGTKLHPEMKYTVDYYGYVLHEIGRIKNGMPPADPSVTELLRLYDAEMRRRGLIDFDDMLVRCRELIRKDPRVLSALRQRFSYIMVDEFQDINSVQFDIIRQIAAPLNNLFIVGDDDQSIYAFRGSDPSIMLSFREFYPDTAVVRLTDNYRSSANIVRSSARLIRHNRMRYKKRLRTRNSTGRRPKFRMYQDAWEEAAAVLSEIASLPPGAEAAVLYRTHKAGYEIGRLFEDASDKLRAALADKTIRLMTFHASKGLEFDAVWIISAEEDITPGHIQKAFRTQRSGSEGAGKRIREELEEERRMFYVAMTRARETLCISCARFRQHRKTKKSRFIREALGILG